MARRYSTNKSHDCPFLSDESLDKLLNIQNELWTPDYDISIRDILDKIIENQYNRIIQSGFQLIDE